MAPILPFLAEAMYEDLDRRSVPGRARLGASDRVADAPPGRGPRREPGGVDGRRSAGGGAGADPAVEAELRTRQPLAGLAGGARRASALTPALLDAVAAEANVHTVTVIDDESELVERRVKPLLPRIGKRLGRRHPGRHGRGPRQRRSSTCPTAGPPGGRRAGRRRGRDPGHAPTGHRGRADDGLVVVIDTTLTEELRAEGDAREIQRAIQDLRRTGRPRPRRPHPTLAGHRPVVADRLGAALERLAADTLADELTRWRRHRTERRPMTLDVSGGRSASGWMRIS